MGPNSMKKKFARGFHARPRLPGLRDIVTVLGLVGGVPGGKTPRVADSSAPGLYLAARKTLEQASKLGFLRCAGCTAGSHDCQSLV